MNDLQNSSFDLSLTYNLIYDQKVANLKTKIILKSQYQKDEYTIFCSLLIIYWPNNTKFISLYSPVNGAYVSICKAKRMYIGSF
jgi:hypothetical protein